MGASCFWNIDQQERRRTAISRNRGVSAARNVCQTVCAVSVTVVYSFTGIDTSYE
jgi:hypothetical protein